MASVFQITCGAILLYMTGWFIAAQVRGRNDIADVAWGLGFILVAAVSLVAGDAYSPRGLLVSGLVLVWGLRLALHIHNRNRGRGEDPRYRKWREEWGKWFVLRSFLQVFMLQGLLLLLVAVPVVFVNQAPPAPLGWLDLLGLDGPRRRRRGGGRAAPRIGETASSAASGRAAEGGQRRACLDRSSGRRSAEGIGRGRQRLRLQRRRRKEKSKKREIRT